MKFIFALALALVLLAPVAAPAASRGTQAATGSAAVGTRYHVDHTVFEAYPYGGDFAYGAAYEWHEDAGYWQAAMDFAPRVQGTNNLRSVWTPQLNLIFNDGVWRGGGGVLNSYLTDKANQTRWTGFYWQFMAGLSLPIQRFSVDVMTYYVFANTKALKEFGFNDMEFGLWLNIPL
jgi:hypothetical protein